MNIIGEIRQTGAPRIEVIKQKPTTLNNREMLKWKQQCQN